MVEASGAGVHRNTRYLGHSRQHDQSSSSANSFHLKNIQPPADACPYTAGAGTSASGVAAGTSPSVVAGGGVAGVAVAEAADPEGAYSYDPHARKKVESAAARVTMREDVGYRYFH